jgi:hypothetical protein
MSSARSPDNLAALTTETCPLLVPIATFPSVPMMMKLLPGVFAIALSLSPDVRNLVTRRDLRDL